MCFLPGSQFLAHGLKIATKFGAADFLSVMINDSVSVENLPDPFKRYLMINAVMSDNLDTFNLVLSFSETVLQQVSDIVKERGNLQLLHLLSQKNSDL